MQRNLCFFIIQTQENKTSCLNERKSLTQPSLTSVMCESRIQWLGGIMEAAPHATAAVGVYKLCEH